MGGWEGRDSRDHGDGGQELGIKMIKSFEKGETVVLVCSSSLPACLKA